VYCPDVTQLRWQNNDSKRFFKVEEFTAIDDVIVLWFKDIVSGEAHCMSENMFLLSFTPKGTFVMEKH
jgi:hypothetical protein